MKKIFVTLATLWVMAWSPNAHAQIDSTRAETKKDLVEVVSKQQVFQKTQWGTIDFEEVQKLHEQQNFIEEVMNNGKIQELVKIHWQEDVQKIINIILNDKECGEILEKLLNDKEIQKALDEWNKEELTKRFEKIMKNYHLKEALRELGALFYNVLLILIWIIWLKKWIESILGYEIIIWRK